LRGPEVASIVEVIVFFSRLPGAVTMTSDHRTSLRGLARTLGVSHAALSKHVHRGSLTAGVGLDAAGRVVVTDPAAAAEQWSTLHVPTIAELCRPPPCRPPPPRDPAPPPPLDFFDDLSKQDLLEAWVAFDLLATALVHDALGADGPGFVDRVTGLLHRIAPTRSADEETVSDAAALLRQLVADRAELAAELRVLQLAAADPASERELLEALVEHGEQPPGGRR
jgi:hypothetical protein